jgi:hypothetical protein
LGWLGSKFWQWSAATRLRELEAFAEKLSAIDASEIGLPLAMATTYRHAVFRQSSIDLLHLADALVREPYLTTKLGKEARAMRRVRPESAVGAIIWLHSARAIQQLELRSAGRAMWAQLSRGFPHVEEAAFGYLTLTGAALVIEDFDSIPLGLGPQT